MNKDVKNIEIIQSRELKFSSAKGEYNLNDILKVEKDNHVTECYLFLNSDDYYVRMPYDSILVSQIKDYTWQKLNDNMIISKSEEEKYLHDIAKLHSIKINVLKGNIKELM